ncbi:GIY-YIG nuclease family protein [Spongiimicrobium sp. 2-473A-2-J]|uniref:GIY-YIG nuclease family protein n=1 Tax=Eudoraea algarum TaxID=3417568 RepID=UPI003D3675B6
MYYVYALWSEEHDKIYVGLTTNPDRRLMEHNEGKSTYTRKYRPWQRFFLEPAPDLESARKKEKYYKSGWGRKTLKSKLEEWQIT